MGHNDLVTEYIGKSNEPQKEILAVLRELIFENIPEINEAIKWGFPVYSMETDIVYFRTTKYHVTLGFNHIDKLEGYLDVLEGKGTTMRHIKLKTAKDIDKVVISTILKALSA